MKLNKYFNNMELILLTNYPQMTQLDMDLIQNGNRLIQEEMLYDVSSLKKEHEILIISLNNEHKTIYNSIMEVVATERMGNVLCL